MPEQRITVVVGNPRSPSRTQAIAERVVSELVTSPDVRVTTIDLAELADELFAPSSTAVSAALSTVAASHLAVFASPTYKGSYTGLLKAFLDRYGSNALAGVIAVPLHTGASLGHAMGTDVHLGTLLTELGAIVPGRGVYVATDDMGRLDATAAAEASRLRQNLERVRAFLPAIAPVPAVMPDPAH
ncbi:NAD(P)H-dependent oxidoreductase [Microbacterium sp. BWT-B31]|uniref:NADPH-dependent FMN reductase n=1 Tax=Microbacterium sp. BWT-B31 TaxID=3232072 RepID=UPI003527CE87